MEITLTEGAIKRRGFARREFIACRDRLNELLNQGHTIASAHDELMAEGIVSMKYRTFAEYIKDASEKTVIPHTLEEPTRCNRRTEPKREEPKKAEPHKASLARLGVDKNEIDELLAPAK